MTRLVQFVAVSCLLMASVGCCCSHGGGGYGAFYPPAGGACPGGNCGIGATPGPGVAQQTFYNSYSTAEIVTPGAVSAPVALGPIIPGPVTYSVPAATTTTYLTTPTTTATLQPLPTY